jgi:bifunctional DNA-binding transcriptional regulator/antitoxin component of YhaV-PrlF toxin-antitoxin module
MWNANALHSAVERGAIMIKSAVTAKFQTTLPSGVRKALELSLGDELAYGVAELIQRGAKV